MSFVPKANTYVDDEIARIVAVMKDQEVNSDEYNVSLERLLKLQKIRHEEKPDRPSSDTLLSVAAHLVGIVLIIRYEHVHVITSKAMSFVPQPKAHKN
jgi:hypothetical protein